MPESSWLSMPCRVTTQQGLEIELLWLQEEHINKIYDIILKTPKDATGYNPDDFLPLERLQSIVKPLLDKQSAISIRDCITGDIIGLLYVHPCPFCRSLSPVVDSGYGIIHHQYQDKGIGTILGECYGVMSVQGGSLGLNIRVGTRGPASTMPTKRGAVVTCWLPSSCKTPAHGWSDDIVSFFYFINLGFGEKMLKMKDSDIKQLAKRTTKPFHPGSVYKCLPIHAEIQLPGGCSATLTSTMETDHIQRSYNILDKAASLGDSFALDEFATLEIYRERYLHSKQLIMIEDEQLNTIGVAFVGPSHLSRSARSPNALVFLYLLPEFRNKGYGSVLLDRLEHHVEEMEFEAILVDLFVSRTMPYNFLKNKGYTLLGSIPFSGYLTGQGWTDCLVFYKNFSRDQILSNL